MTTKENLSIGNLSAASPPDKKSPAPYDLDTVLEAFEEMQFVFPELLPSERNKARMMKIALGLLLFAALVAFCCFG